MGIKNIEDIEYCCDVCGTTKNLSEIYNNSDGEGIHFEGEIYTAEIKEVGVNKYNSRVASYINGFRATNMAYRDAERKVEKLVFCKECLEKIRSAKPEFPKDQYSVRHLSTKKDKESEGSIKLRQFSISICNVVEDLLDSKNITIPNENREGDDNETRIYGDDYFGLEDNIVQILNDLVMEIKNNPDKEIDTDNL